MKTNGLKGTSFGFSALNAGVRNVAVEPQLIVVSTEGSFRITPTVSKALGLANGDYVMFLNNVDNIDAALAARVPEIVEFCEANDLDVASSEAAIAVHKEFDMWAIAKGIVEYDTKGNQKTVSERLTKKDKIRFVSQNFDQMLEAALESDNDEAKEALTREGITKDEQVELLTAFVTSRELPKFKGSKTANPAGMSGVGTSLVFTDSNVWKQLKSDMGDEAKTLNRIFEVNVEELQDVVISNGYEDVTVKAAVLGESVEKEPARVGKSND